MPGTDPRYVWDDPEAFERLVGRWSRGAAREFLGWLRAPGGGRWLDVGCGTGALAEAVLDGCAPASVVAVDPSRTFLAVAGERLGPRARVHVAGTAALPLGDGEIDATVSGLVLNLVPDPAAGVAEMRRVTAPGGTVACYVWDYAGGMEPARHFWDAAVEMDPQAHALDEGVRFPLCREGALGALFRRAGLGEVAVGAIEVRAVFRDFDDYWTPLLTGQGPAPTYLASLEGAQVERLRERVRARLPVAADGSVALAARAWVARGRA